MIEIKCEIAAPVERVWACLTETAQLKKWWNQGVRLEPQSGGHFEEPWVDAKGRPVVTRGTVLGIDPPRKLRLSWSDEDWPIETEVSVELAATDTGTHLALSHAGWQAFPEDDRDYLVESHKAGWFHHLKNLQTYAETLPN
ncbi:MAG: SRPBCC domain-containing protein [Alphaproteobacteria bacterium]|nr:SRPBCC domain-containing protein [Alphaproteobacteria bacterium]